MSKNTRQLENLKRSVRRTLGPGYSTTDFDFQESLVLKAAEITGPNIKRIAAFTGYPREFVSGIATYAREQGLWVGSRVATV
jgi:hypothetical protein